MGNVPLSVAPNIPAVPADIEACEREPTWKPAVALTQGEVEKLWKTDRLRLALVNACFRRIVCMYHDVRKEIGQVDTETVCDAVPTEQQLRMQVPAERPIPRRQKRLE